MSLQPPIPYLTPLGRSRLKVHLPMLRDEDLPTGEMSEGELIAHVVAVTGRPVSEVRAGLEKAGALVPHIEAGGDLQSSAGAAGEKDSYGSGVPDNTSQSGMSSAG